VSAGGPSAAFIPRERAPEKLPVWILRISHRHGSDVTVHRTQDGAMDALYQYVYQWWSSEGLRGRCPENRDRAIARYFEAQADEYWDLDAGELQP
jgi:hypothetical protein